MIPKPDPRTLLSVALLSGLAVGVAHAQSNSATNASGEPVEMATDGNEIVQTDGLIRYGDASEMWQKLQENPDEMQSLAAERWPEIDEGAFADLGDDRDELVTLVEEAYGIEEMDAQREVDAWISETADGM